MAEDKVVGVNDQASPGTTKNVRIREVRTQADDGTISTVEMQVVTLADKDGRLINPDQSAKLDEIIRLLGEILDAVERNEGIV